MRSLLSSPQYSAVQHNCFSINIVYSHMYKIKLHLIYETFLLGRGVEQYLVSIIFGFFLYIYIYIIMVLLQK